MNYRRLYDALIAHAQVTSVEGYVERHHIIPHCMGGVDDKSNIVALTAREHFLAHLLLAKIYGGKLWAAVNMMKRGANTSRLYEIAKKGLAFRRVGVPLSAETRRKISVSARQALSTPEVKAKLSAANRGRVRSNATLANMSASQVIAMGKPETRAKISTALKESWARRKEDARLEKAHFEALRGYRHAA